MISAAAAHMVFAVTCRKSEGAPAPGGAAQVQRRRRAPCGGVQRFTLIIVKGQFGSTLR